MITLPAWVLILWALGWSHFGYSNAKYTRKKKIAQILSVIEILVGLLVIYHYAK